MEEINNDKKLTDKNEEILKKSKIKEDDKNEELLNNSKFKEHYKKEKILNNSKYKEEDKNEEKLYNTKCKEDNILKDILNNYFYEKNGKIKVENATQEEFKIIKNFYKSLLENNKSIDYINECQVKYIDSVINEELEKLIDIQKRPLNNRKYKRKCLIKDLKKSYK